MKAPSGAELPWWYVPIIVVGFVRLGFLARHWRSDHAILQFWWARERFERRMRRLEQ